MSVKRIKINGGVRGHVERIMRGAGVVEVGFFEGSRYADKRATPVAAVATYNNAGTPTIPARPFWDRWVSGLSKWRDVIIRGCQDLLSGKAQPGAMEREIGAGASADLRQIIDAWEDPRNAPATVQRKGKDDPLVDTRQMINAVDWREVK